MKFMKIDSRKKARQFYLCHWFYFFNIYIQNWNANVIDVSFWLTS